MAKISPLMVAPPVIFVLLAGLFYFGMNRDDPDGLPSGYYGAGGSKCGVDTPWNA